MASQFIRINPAGSYLSVDAPSGATKPITSTSVKLSDLGVSPGDAIAFLAQGDYKAGTQFSDDSDGLLAVFVDQSGKYLTPANYRQFFTQKQYSGQQTDILQDFKLTDDVPEGVVIPSNAHSIQFSVEDSFYSDNSDPDGDFGVTIKTGADALLSGADLLRGIDKLAQASGTDDGDGFPFFNLVNVKPFISQNWTSQLFPSGENNYRVTSSQGSMLEITERFTARVGYDSETISLNFLNFLGDKLDFRISSEYTETSNSSVSKGSLGYTWSYLGLASTQSDDVSVRVSLSRDQSETWQSGTTSEGENATLDFSISRGDNLSGLQYQAKGNFVNTSEKRNGVTVIDKSVNSMTSVSYQDFKAGLQISFSADTQEDYLTNKGTFTFKNISGTYQNTTYSSASLILTEKDKVFDVKLDNIDTLTPFFRDVLLPKLSGTPITTVAGNTSTTSSSTSTTPATSTTAPTSTGANPAGSTPTTTTPTTPVATTPVAPIIPNGTERVGSDTVDRLQGGSGPDVIRSGGGNDVIIGSDGTDYIDGGTGVDQISYTSRAGSISFVQDTGGNVQVRLGNKTDTLKDVERVSFTDKAYALDLGGSAGVAAKAIIAAFGKNTVSQYLGVALTMTDKGLSAADLAKIVMDNKMLPSDHGQFVQTVFNNVVGRAPNALEMLQFKGFLDRGEMSTTQLLTLAAESPFTTTVINEVALAGVALEYQPTLSI